MQRPWVALKLSWYKWCLVAFRSFFRARYTASWMLWYEQYTPMFYMDCTCVVVVVQTSPSSFILVIRITLTSFSFIWGHVTLIRFLPVTPTLTLGLWVRPSWTMDALIKTGESFLHKSATYGRRVLLLAADSHHWRMSTWVVFFCSGDRQNTLLKVSTS